MAQENHLKKIIPYLMHYKLRIFLSLFVIIIARLLSVANPYIIKTLVDNLAEHSTTPVNISFMIALVIGFFVSLYCANLPTSHLNW